jgi:phage replication-related protein YjqB (UPF0714/DUF867 family)
MKKKFSDLSKKFYSYASMDRYAHFAAMKRTEREGIDFRVVIRQQRNFSVVVIAPHGGGIEPGTSEVVQTIAANDLSFALFEGLKPHGNSKLHLTSTHFDEPRCCALIRAAQKVIAVHGKDGHEQITYLGGADQRLGDCIQEVLEREGFWVERQIGPLLQGISPQNICNLGVTGRGVQLELPFGLRRTFFESLAPKGRIHPTQELERFALAVRQGLQNAHEQAVIS